MSDIFDSLPVDAVPEKIELSPSTLMTENGLIKIIAMQYHCGSDGCMELHTMAFKMETLAQLNEGFAKVLRMFAEELTMSDNDKGPECSVCKGACKKDHG